MTSVPKSGSSTGTRRSFPCQRWVTWSPSGGIPAIAAGSLASPSTWTRRRTAREHLRRETPELVERQVGRARGDLQYRLAEATRALGRAVGQRYADGTDRIRSALRAAAEPREASAAEAAEKQAELAGREAALRRVIGLLDQAAAGG
jgi:hypothetical protein